MNNEIVCKFFLDMLLAWCYIAIHISDMGELGSSLRLLDIACISRSGMVQPWLTPRRTARLLDLELRDVGLVGVSHRWHPLLLVLFVGIILLKNVTRAILATLWGVEGAHASSIAPRQRALLGC